MSYECENYDCTLPGTQICSTCRKNSCQSSSYIGRYCSRNCQRKCYISHKFLHKYQLYAQKYEVKDGDRTYGTFVSAFQEVLCRKRTLPLLPKEGVFTLLLVGKNEEVCFAYDDLHEQSLQHLNIIVRWEGEEDSDSSCNIEKESLGHVTVSYLHETIRENREDCVAQCTMAMLLNPLLSDQEKVVHWSPLINLLLKHQVVTIVTADVSASLLFQQYIASTSPPEEQIPIPNEVIMWKGHSTSLVLEQWFGAIAVVPCMKTDLVTGVFTIPQPSKWAMKMVSSKKTVTNASFLVMTCGDNSAHTYDTSSPPRNLGNTLSCVRQLYLSYVSLCAKIESDNSAVSRAAQLTAEEISRDEMNLSDTTTLIDIDVVVRERAEEALLPLFMQKQRARQREQRKKMVKADVNREQDNSK